MITTLDQMVDKVLLIKKKHRIAVVWAQDPHTLSAVSHAVEKGFAEALLIGHSTDIITECNKLGLRSSLFTIIDSADEFTAATEAVRMVREGEADILMKGLISTDRFLRAVLDKEKGLMLPGSVLSYVGAIQIPAYGKLLFITDPAVIPFPDYGQKLRMIEYAVEMTARFGINMPRVALIGASEKASSHFPNSLEYKDIIEKTNKGSNLGCIIDGPLDLFLACDPASIAIKGVNTPVDGNADVLVFPSLEASNPFYKSLMLFAGGELAGLIRGTTHPVIVMSRSESEKSKFYCIALACLMSRN